MNCDKTKKEWSAYQKLQADTIKILNDDDDDALELCKKTLPGKTASLLQMRVSANEIRMKALGEKKTYCEEVFEKTEDKQKRLQSTASDLQTAIDDASGWVVPLT